MKVLVFQQDNQLFAQLRAQLDERVEDIVPIPVVLDVIGTMVDVDALVATHEPSYFLCVAQLSPSADELAQKRFRANVELIERAARKAGIAIIFLSSAMVFDGKKLGYKESDSVNPLSETAKVYTALETLIRRKSSRHIILRSSWLFSARPHNFLTNVIDYACANESISLNSAGKASPTAMADLVRVIIAMLLQLEFTQEAWGTYHYTCSDAVIGFQFIESIVAQASQYDERLSPSNMLFAHEAAPCDDFYFEPVVLKCDKIRSVFGVHQKTWRSYLPTAVKTYFELEQAASAKS